MSNDLEKLQQIGEALPGIVDLLTLGIGGVMELANVIKYDKCEIFIENNHHHDISVVLDDEKKNKLKGWYNIKAFSKNKIYKTKRRTHRVGIYAECSECDSYWGGEQERYIPSDGKAFKIEYNNLEFFNNYGDKCVKFTYSNDISKQKEYTFTIN